MNLREARVMLRTRDVGELFDLAGRAVFTLGGRLYLYLFATTTLPLALGCYLLHTHYEVDAADTWMYATMALWINQGLYTIAASRLLFEQRVGYWSILRQFLRRLPAYAVALVLTWLLLFVCTMMVIPLMFAVVWTLFVHEACLLEHQGPLRSIARARVLSKHNFVSLFGFSCLLLLVAVFAVFSAEMLGHGAVGFVLQLGEPFGELNEDGISLYALLGAFAMAPYWATVRFLTYIDGRTRQDGWDIQLRFQHLVREYDAQSTIGGPA